MGYAVRHPARRSEAYYQRIDEWRHKFLRDAADATTRKVSDLGWDRLLLAGESSVKARFRQELPDRLRRRIVGEDEANLLWADPPSIAARIEEDLDGAWRRAGAALVDRAIATAHAGGPAALGWDEVLDTVRHHRVEHLIFTADADPDPGGIAPLTLQALGNPARQLLVERAVEHAVAAGADVTALEPVPDQLVAVGGVAATLRY